MSGRSRKPNPEIQRTVRAHHCMMVVRGVIMYNRYRRRESVICLEGALVRVSWLTRDIPAHARIGATVSLIGRWTSYGLGTQWRITMARKLSGKEWARIERACPMTVLPKKAEKEKAIADLGTDFG